MKNIIWPLVKGAMIIALFHFTGVSAHALTEVNVTEYCADGTSKRGDGNPCTVGYINGLEDGTDDSLGIQKAMDDIGTDGGTVYFPAGIYQIGRNIIRDNPKPNEDYRYGLVGKSNITLKGYGPNSIIKQIANANLQYMIKFPTGSNHFIITDLHIDRNRANQKTYQKDINGVLHEETQGQIYGLLEFVDVTDVTIQRNIFENNTGGTSGGGSGVTVRFGGDNNKNVLISDNTILNSGQNAAIDTNRFKPDGTTPNPKYNLNPCVDKNEQILGSGPHELSESELHRASDGIYFGGANGRIVNNHFLNTTDTAIVFESTNIQPIGSSGSSVIEGNVIENSEIINPINVHTGETGCGIGIAVVSFTPGNYLGAGVTVNGNTIKNTRSTKGAIWLESGKGTGILNDPNPGPGRFLSNCSITNNVIRNTKAGHGMYIENVSDVVISGNTVTDVGVPVAGSGDQTHGITLIDCKNINVSNNIVERATGYGISMNATVDTVVSGNYVRDNNQNHIVGGTGIAVYSDAMSKNPSHNITVIGNHSSGSKQDYGLSVIGNANFDVMVQGNDLRGNEKGGYNTASNSNVRRGFNLTETASNTPETIDYLNAAKSLNADNLTISGDASLATSTGGTTGSLTIGTNGVPIKKHLSSIWTIDFGSIPVGQSASFDWPMTDASPGDTVSAGCQLSFDSTFTALPPGVLFVGFIKANNDVGVTVINYSTQPVNIPSSIYRVDVWKH